MTSRDVVNRVLRIAREVTGLKKIKVGHCGTLDPIATGVLLVCVGQTTRMVSLVQEMPKQYEAEFQLGLTTDTDDVSGQTLSEVEVLSDTLDRESIECLLPRFIGSIEQIPPRFSAVHVEGKRAYDLARQGRDVDLKPRTVEVHELQLTRFERPRLGISMRCGSGTYVRAIGRDIGDLLGCGATMTSLVRSAIGSFELASAIELEVLNAETFISRLQSPLEIVPTLPRIQLSDTETALVKNGRKFHFKGQDPRQGLYQSAGSSHGRAALLTPAGLLVAIAREDADAFQPELVFNS